MFASPPQEHKMNKRRRQTFPAFICVLFITYFLLNVESTYLCKWFENQTNWNWKKNVLWYFRYFRKRLVCILCWTMNFWDVVKCCKMFLRQYFALPRILYSLTKNLKEDAAHYSNRMMGNAWSFKDEQIPLLIQSLSALESIKKQTCSANSTQITKHLLTICAFFSLCRQSWRQKRWKPNGLVSLTSDTTRHHITLKTVCTV